MGELDAGLKAALDLFDREVEQTVYLRPEYVTPSTSMDSATVMVALDRVRNVELLADYPAFKRVMVVHGWRAVSRMIHDQLSLFYIKSLPLRYLTGPHYGSGHISRVLEDGIQALSRALAAPVIMTEHPDLVSHAFLEDLPDAEE